VAGNSVGGKKAAETNKKRQGKDFYKRIGALGGPATNPLKGFGSDRKRAAEAGRKAGKISKRGYTYLYTKRGFNYYEQKSTGEKVSFRAE
jgi:general stress protein YciG